MMEGVLTYIIFISHDCIDRNAHVGLPGTGFILEKFPSQKKTIGICDGSHQKISYNFESNVKIASIES